MIIHFNNIERATKMKHFEILDIDEYTDEEGNSSINGVYHTNQYIDIDSYSDTELIVDTLINDCYIKPDVDRTLFSTMWLDENSCYLYHNSQFVYQLLA